jgi:hypothetical protein
MVKNILLAVAVAAVLAGGIWYFTSKPVVYTPIEAGVPIYPGATNANADTFSSRLKPQDRAKLIKLVIFETADPPQKVIAFYREQLKGKSEILERSSRGIPSAVIRTETGGKPKLIAITSNEDTGKTAITIGNIDEKAKPAK